MHRTLSVLLTSILLFICLSANSQLWQRWTSGNSLLPFNDVTTLAQDDSGRIYAGTTSGMASFRNGVWQQLNLSNLTNIHIARLHTSGDSLLVGTEYNGLYSRYKNVWKNYDPNTAGNGIVGIGKSSKDSLYRLDKFGTFAVWENNSWRSIIRFFDQPNNLFIDRSDRVWLMSNNTGLTEYKDGVAKAWRQSVNVTDPSYIPASSFFDMAQDKNGILWFASDYGLLKYDGTRFELISTANSAIPTNRLRCITIDRKGNIWLGTWDSGVIKYNGNTWVNYTMQNSPLTSDLVVDVLADLEDRIWIANGYNRFRSPSNGQGIYVLDEAFDPSGGKAPEAPAGLQGKVISVNQVILSWADQSDNETDFLLERSAKDSLHFAQIKSILPNTQTFTDVTTNEPLYYYRLRALNKSGYSAYSNTIRVEPKYCVINSSSYGAYALVKQVKFGSISKESTQCLAGYYDYLDLRTSLHAGQTLTLTVRYDRCNITSDPIIAGAVYIDWNADGDFSDNGELLFSNININGRGEFVFPVTVPSFVVPGSTGRLRVVAEDDAYTSPVSACSYAETTQDFTIDFTSVPLPYKPTILSAEKISSREQTIRWQDNAFGESGFLLERSTDGVSFQPVAQTGPNTVSYTDKNLKPGTKYSYRVTALQTSGAEVSDLLTAPTLTADFTRQLKGDLVTDLGFNSGAYWGDFNSDGKYDIFTPGNNILYINADSLLRRTTATFQNSSGAAWADYDNDGDNDLYVTNDLYNGAPTTSLMYENNGNSTFTVRNIFTPDGRMGNAVWTDYNKDGLLDLYVSYLDLGYGKLYRNNKDKTFTMVRRFDNLRGYASFADYDNDGDDDLFVIGNSSPGSIFNLQDTTFTPITTTILSVLRDNARGVSWADYDNDGDLDLLVPINDAGSYPVLYINRGNGNFLRTQVAAAGIAGNAYGSGWADYDNDGYQDLFVSRSQSVSTMLQNNKGTLQAMPSSIFMNENYIGYPFDELSALGTAWADYDNDGFLDLYQAQSNGFPSRLYKNGGNENKWINLTLRGTLSNANAIGAKISTKADGSWQHRWIQSGSGFAADNSIAVEFGLGTAAIIDSMIIRWPSGIVQRMTNVAVNQFLTVTELVSLPVKYLAFEGKYEKPAVRLNWTTTDQSDLSHFTIERSTNGMQFTAIGRKDANQGNNAVQQYSFKDAGAASTNAARLFYRLAETERGNQQQYSKIITVDLESAAVITVAVTPGNIVVRSNREIPALHLKLIGADGKVYYNRTLQAGVSAAAMIPTAGLPGGLYVVSTTSGNEVKTFKVIVKH